MEEGPKVVWYRRYGWVILFVIGAGLALFGLAPIFGGVDANDFESSTGITLETFSAANPDVVKFANRLERLIGVVAFGFGAWTAIVAFVYLKNGDRTAWRAMWLVPIVLGVVAAVFLLDNTTEIGGFYVGMALFALIGQALSRPSVS